MPSYPGHRSEDDSANRYGVGGGRGTAGFPGTLQFVFGNIRVCGTIPVSPRVCPGFHGAEFQRCFSNQCRDRGGLVGVASDFNGSRGGDNQEPGV